MHTMSPLSCVSAAPDVLFGLGLGFRDDLEDVFLPRMSRGRIIKNS